MPRPIWPHPRRFYPFLYGGYGYGGFDPFLGFGLGFGFGFPFYLDYFDYFNWVGPWALTPSYGSNVSNAPPRATMLLYMNDGSAVEATDYWVEGDTLHYVAESGKKGDVAVSDVNVQRTTDANARTGFQFRLDRRQRGTPLDRVEPANPPEEPNPPQN